MSNENESSNSVSSACISDGCQNSSVSKTSIPIGVQTSNEVCTTSLPAMNKESSTVTTKKRRSDSSTKSFQSSKIGLSPSQVEKQELNSTIGSDMTEPPLKKKKSSVPSGVINFPSGLSFGPQHLEFFSSLSEQELSLLKKLFEKKQ